MKLQKWMSLFLLSGILSSAWAAKGGSGTHGGSVVFYLNDQALDALTRVYRKSDCTHPMMDAVFSNPQTFDLNSSGKTSVAIYEGEKIFCDHRTEDLLMVALDVSIHRAHGESNVEAAAALSQCLRKYLGQ